jgi:hypothetical protein
VEVAAMSESIMHTTALGTKQWYLNGELHRVDGPAVEYTDGSRHWYLNGELHRVDGPAVEYANGDRCWYLNNRQHRIDGPAVEFADGSKYWYLNSKEYSFAKYIIAAEWSNEQIIMWKLLQ